MSDPHQSRHPADVAAECLRAGGTANDLPPQVREELLWLWCSDEDGVTESEALAWIDAGVLEELMPAEWRKVGISIPLLVRSGALLDREPHEFRDPAALRAVLLSSTCDKFPDD